MPVPSSRRLPAVLLLSALAAVLPARAHAQAGGGAAPLLTRPERTDFRETSRYEEVVAFLEAAAARAPETVHLDTFGYTLEGRPLPLAVWGRVADASPGAVRASGKTRVLVQANIHAGEVEGKEASLMLLRALAAGEHREWADSLVILFVPIYNADGNERISLLNRPRQHGPVGGMGQRPNAQGLDLNRDHTKLDSPEARSLLLLLNRYDPHVGVDLHATNGTYHAYHLTYAPPLHPNTHPEIVRTLRGSWLPDVTREIRRKDGWDLYHYGNVPSAESPWAAAEGAERGWYTFDHRPRFSNNYVGLRNRFAILSEAYAYLTFRERIETTRRFVEEVLEWAHRHATPIRRVTDEADRASVVGQPLALRAEPQRSGPVEILMGAVAEERNPYSGAVMLRRLPVRRPERMPEYGTFRPTETERAPRAYLVPPSLVEVVERLAAHGVRMRTLERPARVRVEEFRIDSTRVAAQPFQGHRERTVWGRYVPAERTVPAGTRVVPVEQPLGRLAFTLLEPRSDDGFLNWGLLDAALEEAGAAYPVLRTFERVPHAAPPPEPSWVPQESGTTASLRGLGVVSARVAWAGGTGGTFLRTTDGGATWRADTVPGAAGLDFRDVHAVSERTAWLMSAGEGERSRIYRTDDGGRSWTLQYVNPHPAGFFDGMAFWSAEHGIAYSDPVEGRFLVIVTDDGGRSWREVPRESLPPALPGEAGFAASGTGIVDSLAWFATGGAAVARVFRSADRGRSWQVSETPVRAGAPAAGIFSLAFRDARNGVAVGGDYTRPGEALRSAARTTDGGATWTLVQGDPPRGYRSGAAFLPGTDMMVAVGTSGSDLSRDGGARWAPIDTVGYNAVAFAGGIGWAVGPGGRVARWGRAP